MLSKLHRFHGLGSLNHVYRKGEIVRSPYAAMKFCAGKKDTYRVAVVVSKKAAKSAPMRNRIRRRVYQAIANHDKYLSNQDIVVTIFDDRFYSIDYKELESSIVRQLKIISKLSKQK